LRPQALAFIGQRAFIYSFGVALPLASLRRLRRLIPSSQHLSKPYELNGLSPKVRSSVSANYERLLHDPSFWNAFINTVLWSVISLVINIVVPMALAISPLFGTHLCALTLFRSLLFCR